MTADPYSVIGTYYDLLAAPYRQPVLGPLADLLAGCEHGVLEIGAGTGLVTEALARSVPGPIYAAEPSAFMRTALVARLVTDPQLTSKVTVLPVDALAVEPPHPVDAIVLLSVLYALPSDARAALWRRCARLLRPGGLLVFDSPDPQTADSFPAQPMGSAKLGDRRYEGSYTGQTVGPTIVRLTMTYRTFVGDELVDQEQVSCLAHPVSTDALAKELEHAGFEASAAPEGLLAWHSA